MRSHWSPSDDAIGAALDIELAPRLGRRRHRSQHLLDLLYGSWVCDEPTTLLDARNARRVTPWQVRCSLRASVR